MRVLVSSVPSLGHVNPMLPLARSLQEAGNEVVWATSADVCESLRADGFTARQAGPPMAVWQDQLAARTRGRPGDGIRPERSIYYFAPRLFGDVGAALLVDDLLAVARDVEPDVVLFESRCYAAPAVARAVDAFSVLQAVTQLLPPVVEECVNDSVTPLWRDLGLDSPTYAGVFDGLTLSAFPAVLDDPSPYAGLAVHRLRPPASSELPEPVGSWVRDQVGRPLVYATLGTVFSGNVTLLRSMLEALADQEVAVLLTVGPRGEPETLGTHPTHVRIERYVAQDGLLPHCAAVVSHGGSGTTLGALAHGLPHVMLPQGADQFVNAQTGERLGYAKALRAPEQTAEHIGAAVRVLLSDAQYASQALSISAEMARGLSPEQAVALIESALR